MLLQGELDAAVGGSAGGDAHCGAVRLQGAAGEPAAGCGCGGEEADAGELSLSPGVAVVLLQGELDAAVGGFAGGDAHRLSRVLGLGLLGGGRRGGQRSGGNGDAGD